MGEVVLAEHLGLGKLVVVKLLHAERASDPSFVTRMQIEARSLAALTSPHIVQVTDFGQTAAGRTYIVMERLVGCTLGAEVKALGALPVVEALAYVVQVLAGLEAAHAMGIIHRDIKPENIFLCDATKDTPRMVKILDFGVVKALDVATEIGRPALPHLVTEEGGVVGTPRVVAPEQALGRDVDARTDVYATGHLLYTLIAGRGPYAHITEAVDLLKANVMERPEPPSARAPQYIPPVLDAAVLRALEKRPADRFQSAAAFARELRAIAAECARSGPVSQATVGQALATLAGDALTEDDRGEEPTLQFPAAQDAGAAPSPIEQGQDAGREPGSLVRSCVRAPEATDGPAKANAASSLASRRGSGGWATFLALVLLGAAVSAILLLALSRMTP